MIHELHTQKIDVIGAEYTLTHTHIHTNTHVMQKTQLFRRTIIDTVYKAERRAGHNAFKKRYQECWFSVFDRL